MAKCNEKNCNRDAGEYLYCSITCACYDGSFSVKDLWKVKPVSDIPYNSNLE